MIVSTALLVEEDCAILMERALLNKTVCAFGEDGFGLYGKCERAKWFQIAAIDLDMNAEDPDDPATMTGTAKITLAGYDACDNGIIMTDKNFDISIQVLLQNAGIDPAALYWPETNTTQGRNSVTLEINVPLLIGYI